MISADGIAYTIKIATSSMKTEKYHKSLQKGVILLKC